MENLSQVIKRESDMNIPNNIDQVARIQPTTHLVNSRYNLTNTSSDSDSTCYQIHQNIPTTVPVSTTSLNAASLRKKRKSCELDDLFCEGYEIPSKKKVETVKNNTKNAKSNSQINTTSKPKKILKSELKGFLEEKLNTLQMESTEITTKIACLETEKLTASKTEQELLERIERLEEQLKLSRNTVYKMTLNSFFEGNDTSKLISSAQ
ncbi:hypothetical protein HDU92_008996 [Lobulomyces angularis]|nr:hypothetical protein HDU92_008996 [Lobulomyces angularis]